MKKKVFYTEISYVLGLVIMAFAAAFSEKADFGMSMIVAPAYILHLKVSQLLPWFTFGVAEYLFQGVLVLVIVAVMKRFRLFYIFSFVTAFIYGNLLDAAMGLVAPLPSDSIGLRVLWYVLGVVLGSLAVSLFFHTYLAPEAYELIVKELSMKTKKDINKIKTAYDLFSLVLGVALSFTFFGFGVFEGVKWGTVLCAVINGFLIGRFSRLLESRFEFRNRFRGGKAFGVEDEKE